MVKIVDQRCWQSATTAMLAAKELNNVDFIMVIYHLTSKATYRVHIVTRVFEETYITCYSLKLNSGYH